MALGVGDRRDAEQRPAVGRPGSELGGIDAGRGDMHPVSGQPIELPQPPPGPRAGGDDAGRGREDRALAGPGVVGPAVCGAAPQRHVHEHDEAQPAGLGHEHLGGRGRDQPVEQHDGVVGNAFDDAGQGGERRRVGPAPEAGHRVLVHRPAQRGQPTAQMAVIDVAAGGAGRVIDAVGQDGMDRRHRGRS